MARDLFGKRVALIVNTYLTNVFSNPEAAKYYKVPEIPGYHYYFQHKLSSNGRSLDLSTSYGGVPTSLIKNHFFNLSLLILAIEEEYNETIDITVCSIPVKHPWENDKETFAALSKVMYGGLSPYPVFALSSENEIPVVDNYMEAINKKISEAIKKAFKDLPIGLGNSKEEGLFIYCNDCRKIKKYTEYKTKLATVFSTAKEEKLAKPKYYYNKITSIAPKKVFTPKQREQPVFKLGTVNNEDGLLRVLDALGEDVESLKKELALLNRYKNVRKYI